MTLSKGRNDRLAADRGAPPLRGWLGKLGESATKTGGLGFRERVFWMVQGGRFGALSAR